MRQKKRAARKQPASKKMFPVERQHHIKLKQKNQQAFIREHPRFHFFLDLAGNIFYEKEWHDD